MLERPDHDARLGSLEKAARALGLPCTGVRRVLADFLSLHPESIRSASLRILADGHDAWTIHLFDFVDEFRADPDPDRVEEPPRLESPRIGAVLAGTVEALCAEVAMQVPVWCRAVPNLETPWFVAGVENLKAAALAESPIPFRSRNVFVLGNFLERA